jgi:hypothetical protein
MTPSFAESDQVSRSVSHGDQAENRPNTTLVSP